ncbi:hypothetical protein [Puniceibacterium sp. IMCC21224]|uniref:hypothetical protein n=1 Tax=Puniceibacterium sp. IMCC21224 TaxID=1618204 RepID=UPI00064DE68B|nr:hypothetical protein [Puniceibacterium sp. IMCC21224]KMK67150.1 hypothetical protein IMCC21224_112014 [Puniceibacterium sp. IMCC21224]
MTWTEITENWTARLGRLQQRFPNLDRKALRTPPKNRPDLSRHLAQCQRLTAFEAEQELDDWLFVESLAQHDSDAPSR